MKKNNIKETPKQIKNDLKLDHFINDVKKGKYSKEPVNGSLRINTCYTVNNNNNNNSYIFGVK